MDKRLNLVDDPADCCRICPLAGPSRNRLRNAFKIDPTGASHEESIDSSLFRVREV
jgi:hypothetical protein